MRAKLGSCSASVPQLIDLASVGSAANCNRSCGIATKIIRALILASGCMGGDPTPPLSHPTLHSPYMKLTSCEPNQGGTICSVVCKEGGGKAGTEL